MIRQNSKVIVVQFPNGVIKVSQVTAEFRIKELEEAGCIVTKAVVDNSINGESK